MTIAAGQPIRADDVLAALAGTHTVLASGHFYADLGAQVVRYGDRLLAGAAVDCAADADRTITTDWLSAIMATTTIGPWAVWGATTASLARYGTIGLLGASRTSDAQAWAGMLGYVPASIGVAAWGIADDTTNPTTTTAWAYYGEAWRMPGADVRPVFGMELDGVNLGGAISHPPNPYAPNVGGGISLLQLASGGGHTSGTSDIASAITIVSNPNKHQAGLVVGATALTGTNGEDGGYGSAIVLSNGHGIEWHTAETYAGIKGYSVGASVYSQVTVAAQGGRVVFQNNAVNLLNNSGQSVFSVSTAGTPTNVLQTQSGAGTQAAGLYVLEGSGGSANLGLFPASGGELQIQSPVGNVGGAIAATAGGGFLHISVNGAEFRIALLTPAQAGG